MTMAMDLKKSIWMALVMLVLLMAVPCTGDIYVWTDGNGVKHFSNQPPPDKQEIKTQPEVHHEAAQYKQWDQQRLDNQKSAIAGNQSRGATPPASLSDSTSTAGNPGPVIMYATPTCGYCKRARTFFAKHGIAYTEYNIASDKSALQRFKSLNGRGVPLIYVGDKRVPGFNKPLLKQLFGIK
jgi:glutaredoxin